MVILNTEYTSPFESVSVGYLANQWRLLSTSLSERAKGGAIIHLKAVQCLLSSLCFREFIALNYAWLLLQLTFQV